ncbi:MAG: cation:proton antiporter [Gammaproteobacteria bacterium]|nr:cation:proton antiporter [Gammaproteobacteria bacterium]
MEAIWITATFALGLAVRFIGLPTLIGFLLSGFVLSAMGYESVDALDRIAHLGILLLLFTVGLKLRLRSVLRAEVFGGALIHLGVSTLLLAPAIHWLAGLAWGASLLLAIALGFSSTVVAAKLLEQKRELRAFHGRVAIGILIVQDLVAVATLSIAGDHAPSPWALLLFALPFARPLLYKLLDASGHDELFVLLGLLLALVAGGLLFEHVGLSSELGALVLGALLAEHPRAKEMSNSLWGLKEVFLVGFFLQIGLFGLPTWNALVIAVGLGLLLPLKAALFFLILLRFKLRARSSFLTGLSLASYSEFGLIVANLGADAGWFGQNWVVVLAITVAVSFVVAAPLNRRAHDLYQRFEKRLVRFERPVRHPDDEPIALGSAQIAIIGMGRVGTGAYDFLTQRNERVVGLDSDPGKIERHRSKGRRVLYADAEDPGFWQKLKLDDIKAILLAVPEVEAKRIAATQLRLAGYKGLIGATIVFAEESEEIAAAGCDLSFNYYDEVGVGFAEHVWEALYPEEPGD